MFHRDIEFRIICIIFFGSQRGEAKPTGSLRYKDLSQFHLNADCELHITQLCRWWWESYADDSGDADDSGGNDDWDGYDDGGQNFFCNNDKLVIVMDGRLKTLVSNVPLFPAISWTKMIVLMTTTMMLLFDAHHQPTCCDAPQLVSLAPNIGCGGQWW